MSQIIEQATKAQTFFDETERSRSKDEEQSKDVPPVFNKRLFATQGNVIITREARRVMTRNAKAIEDGQERHLTKSELLLMRTVVDGLKLIHKNYDYIKDALCHTVTMETGNPFEYVVKKPWEDQLSCYYIVHGAVEVSYDMSSRESRNVYQPHIIYSHGTGEYLGIVSAESRDEDISPPATVYTKEMSEFLRIDRERFHKLIDTSTSVLEAEIRDFFKSGESVFCQMPDSSKEKIFPLIEKQEYPPNKVIIDQGEIADFLYIIRAGRCQCQREVYVPESNMTALFYVSCREPNDFFGEECLLDMAPSYARITTTSATVCYKIPRVAFQVLNRDVLSRFVEDHRHEFPQEDSLMDRGYRNTLWNNYKFSKIKESLKEKGKLHYMCTSNGCRVNERPPSARDQYKENMYRFIMNGAQFTPFRARSAVFPSHQTNQPHHRQRPATAIGRMTVAINDEDANTDNEGDDDIINDDAEPQSAPEKDEKDNRTPASTLLTTELARMLESHCSKGIDDKETLLELLDGNSELSKHIKKAWESTELPQEEKEGFMKNGVLVTMKSDDIVRKAMAMAEKQVQQRNRGSMQDEDWDAILQAEHNQAKFMLSANKMRIDVLRDKLMVIDKHKRKALQERSRIAGTEYKHTPSRFLQGTTEEDQTKAPGPGSINNSKDTTETPQPFLGKKAPLRLRQRSLEDCTKRLKGSKEHGQELPLENGSIHPRPRSAIVTRRDAKLRRRHEGSKESVLSLEKSDSQNSIIYKI